MARDALGEAIGFLLKRSDERSRLLHFPAGGEERRRLRKLGDLQSNRLSLDDTIETRDNSL